MNGIVFWRPPMTLVPAFLFGTPGMRRRNVPLVPDKREKPYQGIPDWALEANRLKVARILSRLFLVEKSRSPTWNAWVGLFVWLP